MAKYVANLAFVAHVEIEALDAEAAKIEAEYILDTHSVYADAAVKKLHDEAYCAGGMGGDPPLRQHHKQVVEIRNADFVPDEITIQKGSEK